MTILPDLTWAEAAPRWAEADRMGFDHLWTYDHITWGGLPDSRWTAAIPTLVAAASVTSRAQLGTFVSSPNNHHPVQFARELTVLDDVSGGRALLGLGSGGNGDSRILGEDLGLGERVDRFHEFVDLLDRLLREPKVSADGRYYRALDVTMAGGPWRVAPGDDPGAQRIPLLIAANGPRTVRLAAARGDGWVTYGGPAETDDEWWGIVARLCHTLDEALEAQGRERHTYPRYLNVDSAPTFSLSSVDAFTDAIGRAGELGFTDVIVHWPRESEPYAGSRAVLDAVAADVLPGLR